MTNFQFISLLGNKNWKPVYSVIMIITMNACFYLLASELCLLLTRMWVQSNYNFTHCTENSLNWLHVKLITIITCWHSIKIMCSPVQHWRVFEQFTWLNSPYSAWFVHLKMAQSLAYATLDSALWNSVPWGYRVLNIHFSPNWNAHYCFVNSNPTKLVVQTVSFVAWLLFLQSHTDWECLDVIRVFW